MTGRWGGRASDPQAILTPETLQGFDFDFREAPGNRQLQETLRTGFLFLLPGRHWWKPADKGDGNVVEAHGGKASETGATSQHIYGAIWRFVAPILLP